VREGHLRYPNLEKNGQGGKWSCTIFKVLNFILSGVSTWWDNRKGYEKLFYEVNTIRKVKVYVISGNGKEPQSLL
jgi:hypothetical protein